MSPFWLAYHLVILGLLLGVTIGLGLNLLAFRSLRPARRQRESAPRISVLIPARDEEERLPVLLRSLLAQEYPNYEVIVLDDNSTDRTSGEARQLGFTPMGSDLRLVRGKPLEPGWVGKCWACHQLSELATGDYLLFTDADTEHAPGVLAAAVEMAEDTGADLLSAWPRLVTRTWSEHLIIPLIHLLAVAFYPHMLMRWLSRRPWLVRKLSRARLRSLGAANGQFLFFRRESYDRIGGHVGVKDHLVEDVALGRAVAERMGDGMRLVNCDASAISQCRMYRTFDEVWEGFTKNLRAAFETSLSGFILMGAMQTCAFLLPFIFILLPLPGRDLLAGQIGLILIIRAALTLRLRTSWWSVIGHPAGLTLALLIAVNSWRRLSGLGVTWKGRSYGGKPGGAHSSSR